MNILEITKNLYLIPLDQNLPGFKPFIASWLYKGEKNFIVDSGPASTIPVLLKALETLDVTSLDAVLLTHIHIDHAGGIGDLSSRFPDTPIVCHKSAFPHLKDPSRLWEGSLKTLGAIAQAYGPIQPVRESLLCDAAQFRDFGITPFLTPGHAVHHVSYLFGDYLFGGEAGGVFTEFPDSSFYLRPATPPRFFLETSVQSVETLLQVPHKLFCYGHFGATKKTPELLEANKRQLFEWADIIREQMRTADTEAEMLANCMKTLLQKDRLLAQWRQMDAGVRQRETTFFHNSIRGFVGYLKET
ncbi:MAG: hypothetical protein BWK80_37735 [Desulfobacteraceae bacterium IS3]|nr:MAG: hypothetical protein BWK80_37735 [Desulfobacteraceae bacterium IS3]